MYGIDNLKQNDYLKQMTFDESGYDAPVVNLKVVYIFWESHICQVISADQSAGS